MKNYVATWVSSSEIHEPARTTRAPSLRKASEFFLGEDAWGRATDTSEYVATFWHHQRLIRVIEIRPIDQSTN